MYFDKLGRGRRKALIIGISEYDKLDDLKFCENDGRTVSKVLLSHNYEIPSKFQLIGRVEGHKLREQIIDFFTHPDVTLEDTLLLYYSGHGTPDSDGRMYLCPSEIDEDYPYRRGFSFQDLTDMMTRSISKKIVVILDCCFSGTAELSKGSEHDAAKLGNAAILKLSNTLIDGEGRCILASSQANQEAYGLMEENHSVFTHFLIRGLNGDKAAMNSDGYVTADSIGKFIYEQIMSLPVSRRPKQKPVRKMDMSGEIVLVHYPENNSTVKTKELEPLVEDIGEQYFEKEQYKEALDYYSKITIDPSKAGTWIKKGIAQNRLGNNAEALKCFEIALALDPTNAKAWGLKGSILYNLEKYENALEDLQKSIDLDPSDENFWYCKGMSLYRLGSINEALICLNKSIEINSKASLALVSKGDILKQQGKLNEALSYYERSLEIDPKLPFTWHNKGLLLYDLNRKEDAIYCYEKAIEYYENYPFSPGIDAPWNCKGNCLSDLGKNDEALECYSKAIENNPKNGTYWINKSLTLLNLKMIGEAVDSAEYGMIVDRNSDAVMTNGTNMMICSGCYLCILDRYNEAAECFERLHKINSTNEQALNYMNMTINNPRQMKKIALDNMNDLPWFHKFDLDINWSQVLNKKAFGTDDFEFGIITEIQADHLVIKKGIFKKENFYLPKRIIERYDGHKIWFKINKDDLEQYKKI